MNKEEEDEDFFDWDSLLENTEPVSLSFQPIRNTDSDFLRYLGNTCGKIADWFLHWQLKWGDEYEAVYGLENDETQDN